MQYALRLTLVLGLAATTALAVETEEVTKKVHHKGHHHKHHHKHHKSHANLTTPDETKPQEATTGATIAVPKVTTASAGQTAHVQASSAKKVVSEDQVVAKMKSLEKELSAKEKANAGASEKGTLEVNGPLPADFSERFAQAAGRATGAESSEIKVLSSSPVEGQPGVVEVVFEAPVAIVHGIEDQAADPSSKLANSPLHHFLVADGAEDGAAPPGRPVEDEDSDMSGAGATPMQTKGIDIDTEMPYGELEPFGREDTAQELTEQSVQESDAMVDQLERAEVAEEKRSVFRALTRLRGAAITSFDGIARSQTGNIDEYNKVHQWRTTHPLHHLADEESDISKWAFPDNADF